MEWLDHPALVFIDGSPDTDPLSQLQIPLLDQPVCDIESQLSRQSTLAGPCP